MRISVEEAARKMGVSPRLIHLGLQHEKFPFGTAIPTSKTRFTYYINRNRFEKWLAGEDMKEVEE